MSIWHWLWRALRPHRAAKQPQPYLPMTAQRVAFSFRVYWTKLARTWSAEERIHARDQALVLVQAPGFQDNLIEKRHYLALPGVPETHHSGTSLRALLDVLDALDTAEQEIKHEQ